MSTEELRERGTTVAWGPRQEVATTQGVAWVPRREVDTTQGGRSQGPVELSGRTLPGDYRSSEGGGHTP